MVKSMCNVCALARIVSWLNPTGRSGSQLFNLTVNRNTTIILLRPNLSVFPHLVNHKQTISLIKKIPFKGFQFLLGLFLELFFLLDGIFQSPRDIVGKLKLVKLQN